MIVIARLMAIVIASTALLLAIAYSSQVAHTPNPSPSPTVNK